MANLIAYKLEASLSGSKNVIASEFDRESLNGRIAKVYDVARLEVIVGISNHLGRLTEGFYDTALNEANDA